MASRPLLFIVVVLVSSACSQPPATPSPTTDSGVLWVKYAAEYRAVSMQVYKQAELALPGLLENRNWSAMPVTASALREN